MKYIFLLISLISLSSFASVDSKALTCSKIGTTVLWINGVDSDVDQVVSDVMLLKNNVSSGSIDSKSLKYDISYNRKNGFKNDLLESAAQKLSLQFNISIEKSFIATHFAASFPSLTVTDIKNILPEWQNEDLQSFYDYVNGLPASDAKDEAENALTQWDQLNYVSADLKSKMSQILLSGRKLLVGSHSQGNLFVAKAIQDFINGELLSYGGASKPYSSFNKFISHLSIASPVNSPISKVKYVLNDKDVINAVFFGAPAANFDLEFHYPDPRDWTDIAINHYFDQTYLNSRGQSSTEATSLNSLKAFTLQSLIDAAELLESNCPIANFTYQIDGTNNLKALFDATSSINSDGMIHKWNFGDSTPVQNLTIKTTDHTFPSAATYNVKLTLTDENGTDFGPDAEKQLSIILQPATTGCNLTGQPVSGRKHTNPDGTVGGFIASGSTVSSTVYISSNSEVCGTSNIQGTVYLEVRSKVINSSITQSGTQSISLYDTAIVEGSTINGGGITINRKSTVKNSQITGSIGIDQSSMLNSTSVGKNINVHGGSVLDGAELVNLAVNPNNNLNIYQSNIHSTITVRDYGPNPVPPNDPSIQLSISRSTVNAAIEGYAIFLDYETVNTPISGTYIYMK